MKQATVRARGAPRQRVNDPEGTRRNIVEVAMKEFADKGLSGARVDKIAARTKTSKRMIYYYFGGKEQLARLDVPQEAPGQLRLTLLIDPKGHGQITAGLPKSYK